MTDTATVASNEDCPNSAVVMLDTPFTRGDITIDRITLLRTDLGGLRGLSLVRLAQMDVDEVRTLLPRITVEALISQEVDRLDVSDTMQIAIELGEFLTAGDTVAELLVLAGADQRSLVRVPLGIPIRRGETFLKSITLRRPDTGALRGISLSNLGKLNVDEMLAVLPRITLECLTPEEAASIDMADGMTIGGEIGDFLLPKRLRAA